jgi:hypothetical protein
MNTVTIVVVGIWNAILLTGLAALIIWRKRVLRWVTQLDGQRRGEWVSRVDERWESFLDQHPELTER